MCKSAKALLLAKAHEIRLVSTKFHAFNPERAKNMCVVRASNNSHASTSTSNSKTWWTRTIEKHFNDSNVNLWIIQYNDQMDLSMVWHVSPFGNLWVFLRFSYALHEIFYNILFFFGKQMNDYIQNTTIIHVPCSRLHGYKSDGFWVGAIAIQKHESNVLKLIRNPKLSMNIKTDGKCKQKSSNITPIPLLLKLMFLVAVFMSMLLLPFRWL